MKQLVVNMDWTDFFLRVIGMVLALFFMLAFIFELLVIIRSTKSLIMPASSPTSIFECVISVVALIFFYRASHHSRSLRFIIVTCGLALAGPVLLWLMGIQSRTAFHRASIAYLLFFR